MSNHVWLRKPTAKRAAELLDVYNVAVERGIDTHTAELLAVHHLERRAQSSYTGVFMFVDSMKRSGCRFMQGKNVGHYRRCWNAHVRFMLRSCANLLWDLHRNDNHDAVRQYDHGTQLVALLESVETYDDWLNALDQWATTQYEEVDV